MDPQQRLLLETAWEALETAGYGNVRRPGRMIGMFVGAGRINIRRCAASGCRREHRDFHAQAMLAGRVAYLLGLHGPSLTLDTACSSSLVAVHLACQSLRPANASWPWPAG